jgi:hypothetical protein
LPFIGHGKRFLSHVAAPESHRGFETISALTRNAHIQQTPVAALRKAVPHPSDCGSGATKRRDRLGDGALEMHELDFFIHNSQ